jgi:hypothetical protein
LDAYKLSSYRTTHGKKPYFDPRDLGSSCTPWGDSSEGGAWVGFRASSCACYFNLTSPCARCFKSPLRPMGAWINGSGIFTPPQLGALWAQPVWRMCFGGGFAVQRTRVWAWPRRMWQQLSDSLARANSIEEGHYTERLWGRLLSPELSAEETQTLVCAAKTTGLYGVLLDCDCRRERPHTHYFASLRELSSTCGVSHGHAEPQPS